MGAGCSRFVFEGPGWYFRDASGYGPHITGCYASCEYLRVES